MNTIDCIIECIKPLKTNYDLIRIGDKNDGGYLIPNDLEEIKVCFSPGVGDTASFERFLYENFNIKSHLMDCDDISIINQDFLSSFDKNYLSYKDDKIFKTLETWIAEKEKISDSDYILQMDIEGGEYEVITSTSLDTLKKFRIMVIEFHFFENFTIDFISKLNKTFSKISKEFISIHLHPNNCCGNIEINEKILPRVFEVTFLRKDRSPTFGYCDKLPHPLDSPNVPYNEDLILDEKSFKITNTITNNKTMNLMQIYSVPLWNSEYPEFEEHKEIFLNAVRTYKEENPSVQKSNITGYHSPETLQGVPELRPLFEYICQLGFKAVADLDFVDCDIALTSAWLNINDSRQCMNSEHVHGEVFSGVFYLSAPDESGKLVLQNPAINRMWKGCALTSQKNQFTGESIRIEPVEGNILLFPAYLPHSVETNNHDEERISISFNIIALPKGTIEYPQPQE